MKNILRENSTEIVQENYCLCHHSTRYWTFPLRHI